jgi:acyl-CoA oxidase
MLGSAILPPQGETYTQWMDSLTEDAVFTSDTPDLNRRFQLSANRLRAGRLLFASEAVACCRAATQIVIRYAHQRLTSGAGSAEEVPLIAYRSYRRPVFTALAYTYAATFMIRHARHVHEEATEHNQVEVEQLIALTKAATSGWAERLLAEPPRCRTRRVHRRGRQPDPPPQGGRGDPLRAAVRAAAARARSPR